MNSGGRTTRLLTALTIALEKTQVTSNYYRTIMVLNNKKITLSLR